MLGFSESQLRPFSQGFERGRRHACAAAGGDAATGGDAAAGGEATRGTYGGGKLGGSRISGIPREIPEVFMLYTPVY